MDVSVLITLFVPLLLGYFLIETFLRNIHLNCILKWGLGCGLGFGLVAQWMLFLGSFGLPLNAVTINVPVFILLMIVMCVFYVQRDLKPIFSLRFGSFLTFTFFDLFLFFVIIFYLLNSLVGVLFLHPIIGWDVIATVAYKAKVFFYERSFLHNSNLPHASYPLQIPLLMSWVAFTIGEWHEYFPQIVIPIYFGSLICVVYGFLRAFVNRRFAFVGVVLLCFSNYVILHSLMAYRDLPLAFYNSSVIFLILLWHVKQDSRLLFLAGIFAGFAAFTKLEGMGYIFIYCLFLVYVMDVFNVKIFKNSLGKKVQQFLIFFLPVFFLVAAYQIFKIIYHVPFGEEGKTELILTFELITRMPIIAQAFLKNMFWTVYWGLNWYLLTACFLFSFRDVQKIERKLLCAIFLFFIVYGILFLFTPNYTYLLNLDFDVLLPRLFLHFFPLCPVLTAIMLYHRLPERIK